jgi:hypothetical protein
VTTSGEYNDDDQVFAAGFLEGYLTAERIVDNWHNLRDYFKGVMNASLEEPMKVTVRGGRGEGTGRREMGPCST